MDFLKNASRIVAPALNKKNPKSRRSLQFETLENRELLAVSLLGTPISGYAVQGSETEIRFDLATDTDGYAKVDFTVRAENGLNPSELSLYNHTTGQTIVLSNIIDGSTSSSASAILTAGTYSVYVGSDSGRGTFTIDILHDDGFSNTIGSALPILVEAALAQQQSGWASRVSYYNKLLSHFGYGSNSLNGKPVQELFPEVDVNGDGIVTSADYDLSLQLISGAAVTPSITTTPAILVPDVTAPTITTALKNDTGTAGDKITIDTTIVGHITDASGIASARYKLDNGSWISLTVGVDGNYTIPHQDVAEGSHTITVSATDTFGNVSTATTVFTYATSTAPGGSTDATISDAGSGNVSLGSEYAVSRIEGQAASVGTAITLSGDRGTVTLEADGSLSFMPGSYYDRLAQGETAIREITVVSRDEHGREYFSTISFLVTGKNDLPVLASTTKPSKTIAEGTAGTIAASTILALWTDIDNGATLSVTQAAVSSVSCTNSSLSSTYTTNVLAGCLSADSTGVTFDASADLFKALGVGDSLTVTVSYKISDGIGTSAQTGYLTFLVNGKDDPSILSVANSVFDVISNDLNDPLKMIDAGFSVSDPEAGDAIGFVYSIKNAGDTTPGLIVEFDSTTGIFGIDTSKLADRDSASALTVVVSVKSQGGGTAEQTLIVNLNPLAAPIAETLELFVREGDSASGNVTPVVAGNGYAISGLTLLSGTLPNGVSLDSLASIDAAGMFRFDSGDDFNGLTEGEKAELVFLYTVADAQYGLTGTGTITVTITGVASPAVAPENALLGTGGKYSSRENEGVVPNIFVSKNDLLEGWMLPEPASVYSIVPGTARFDSWSDGTTNPLSSTDFGTISVDADGNMVLTPAVGLYDVLGEGQWIDILVEYGLRNDTGGSVVSGGQVLIRITGRNADPELSVETDSFSIASNALATQVLDPRCSATDVDLNDAEITYAIDSNAADAGFTVDGKTGVIAISTADLDALSGTHVIVLTARDSHGGTASRVITVDIYKEPNPTVSKLTIKLDENSVASENLFSALTRVEGHTYSIDNLRYVGTSEILPADISVEDLYVFSDNLFAFSTAGRFEFLSEGETLTLIFVFTVTDNGFSDCVSTGKIEVIVTGRNDSPTFIPGGTRVVEASNSAILDWQTSFADGDRNDIPAISRINGLSIEAGMVEIEGLGTFHYDARTRALTFVPSSDFDTLAENVSAGMLPTLTLTVVDGNGGSVEGPVELDIIGTNKIPVVVGGDYQTPVDRILVIPVEDFVTDRNTADAHTIVSIEIDGTVHDFQGAKTIILSTGTTITLSEDRTTLTIDPTGRTSYPNDGKPETISLDVVVTDGKNFRAISEPGRLTVAIGATAPKVENTSLSSVAENATTPPTEIVLSDLITDTNIPIRENDSKWYVVSDFKLVATFGDRELSPAEYAAIAGFWEYSNEILSFDAPEGHFDFLAAGESILLEFTYTIRDAELTDENGNTLSADGEIMLRITGANTDPVVVSGDTEYALSNSGLAGEATIPLGSYVFEDVDRRGDGKEQWSITGLSDPSLEGIVTIDSFGNLALDNSKAPSLLPGESKIFSFDVTITDGNGGTGHRTVTVALYGKKAPILDVDPIELHEGETSQRKTISVTDPEENFMPRRTGDDWYAKPAIVSVDVPDEYAGRFTAEELLQLFTVTRDADSGYSIEFNADVNRFDFLNEGEKLVFTIDLLVTDPEYDVRTSATITCTITGKGDPHSVGVADPDFEFWCNEQNVTEKSHGPGYAVVELDAGETHSFTLAGISGALPEGFLPEHLTVDPASGLITVRHEGFAALTEDTTYTLTIDVTGNVDGLSVPVTITLHVKRAEPPTVEPGDMILDETGNAALPILVQGPTDGAPRDAEWYAISPPSYVSHDGTLPVAGTLPTGYGASIVDGKFVFETNGVFDYLSHGESLELVFEFTVTDTRYGATTSQTATVTVTGVNSTPEAADVPDFNGGAVGDDALKLADLETMIDDTDENDRHTLLEIDGVAVVHDQWIVVSGRGQFLYTGGVLRDDGLYYDGELWYKPRLAEDDASDELETLGCGISTPLEFTFVFKDDSGRENAEGRDTLTVNVRGTNKAPTMNANRFDLAEGEIRTYTASELAKDRNTADTLRIYSINGAEVRAGDVIYLEDNTKITIGEYRLSLEVDTTTRFGHMNLVEGETWTDGFYLVIDDGTGVLGATNDKTFRTWTPLTVTGIDDPPVLPEFQEFGFSMDGKDTSMNMVGTVYLADADTDRADYKLAIAGGFTIVDSTIDASGFDTEFSMRNNGNITLYDAPPLADGDYVVYEFEVRTTRESDPDFEKYVTVRVTVSTRKTPDVVVTDGGAADVFETNIDPLEFGVTVTDRNEGRTAGWYSYRNIRFVEGDCSWTEEKLSTLPGAASFGFYEGTNTFHFDAAGAFDFLSEGESVVLTFEFTVYDDAYDVSRTETITVTVRGANAAPAAFDDTAPFHVSADTTKGIIFRLVDLASDDDLRDTLSFDTVDGQTITLDGAAIDVLDDDKRVMGSVRWLSDTENGDYLLFNPNVDGSSSAEIRYELLKPGRFTFTVKDAAGEVSNEATIDFQVRGTNKTPEFTRTELPVNEDKTLEIAASDIAADVNAGDTLTIVGIRVGDLSYEIDPEHPEDVVIPFESGSILTLRVDGTLSFDPTGRNENLRIGVSADESFVVIVSDDSGANTASARNETVLTVGVTGVNDSPEDIRPETTDVSGNLGSTVRVDLNDVFRDADGDTLSFSIRENPANDPGDSNPLGFLEHYYVDTATGELVLVFMSKNAYSEEFDFTPPTLRIVAFDGTDETEKTLSIRAEKQHTVMLEIKSPEQVSEGRTYSIEVYVYDSLNESLQNESASSGLIDVSFALYYDKELCEIDASGISGAEMRDGCIVFSTRLEPGNFEARLLELTVTAKGVAGKTESAEFWFDNVTVTRNNSDSVLHASQIELGTASVRHVGAEISGTSLVVGFSAPSPGAAFSTLQNVLGWTSEDELVWGDRDQTDPTLLDQVFEDDDLLGGTGYAAGLSADGNDYVLDADIEEILAEIGETA